MTLDNLKHSAILTTFFKMADDNDLMGATEFIKGEFTSLRSFCLANFDSLCYLSLRSNVTASAIKYLNQLLLCVIEYFLILLNLQQVIYLLKCSFSLIYCYFLKNITFIIIFARKI